MSNFILDGEIRAHKIVLCSASKHLENILETNPDQTSYVFLDSVLHQSLEMVIQFIYFGQCDVSQEDLSEFLATGKALGVSDLLIENIDELARKIESEPINLPTTIELDTLYSPQGQAVWPTHEEKDNFNKIIIKEKIVGPVQCKMCGSVFSQLGGLNQHVKSVHEGKKYDCDQCEYRATQPSSIKIHKQVKHVQAKLQCPQCDYQSGWPTDFRKHKLAKHDGIRYGCDICDYIATRPECLGKHMKSQHYNHYCSYCDFTSQEPATMKNHKKEVHDIPIPDCSYISLQPSQSNDHKKRVNSIQYFECDRCDFKSSHRTTLNNHYRFSHNDRLEQVAIKKQPRNYNIKHN